jgi:acyl-coenzyme A synthetase/AMP-(fatty) acid ligase
VNAAAEGTSNAAAVVIDRLIATNRGDRDAFSYNGKRYSFQDVAALMNRAGSMLKAMGVPAGANVLLALPPSPALVGSLLGAMKAGFVPIIDVPADAEGLARCIAETKPVAAIVHEQRLPAAERALAPLPHEAVVVVGADVHGHRSFVHEMRDQPSWLPAANVRGDAPALRAWTGSAASAFRHADVTAWADETDAARANGDAGEEARTVKAMLCAFAKGETATLA